ncbi:MAG TPA: hypothetical protein VFO41_12975 [Alphaproteobacteria bacterium]|nr:hypothetical protein [Alphaproteobacteria bacterium]
MQDTVQRTVDRPGPFAVRTLPLATILFGGGVLLLLWAGIGGIVHQEWDRAIDQARRDTTNLALAFRVSTPIEF